MVHNNALLDFSWFLEFSEKLIDRTQYEGDIFFLNCANGNERFNANKYTLFHNGN